MTNDQNTQRPAGPQPVSRLPDSLTIYYDGLCPLCLAEIHVLTARNRRGLMSFIDISDKYFAAAGHPVSCAEAMARMHGRLGNGQLLTGVSVFVAAYRRADLGFLAWLFSRAWTKPILDLGYGWFARYRHSISRVIGPPLLHLARWWISAEPERLAK
jgi:predicted DCC family thiol-disulfide oxidoreductase YuxK